MKKFLYIFFPCLFAFLCFTDNIFAVSYNGSSVHTFPAVLSATGDYVYYPATAGTYQFSLYVSSGSDTYKYNTLYFRGTSGLVFSGVLFYGYNYDAGNSRVLKVKVSYFSSEDRIIIGFYNNDISDLYNETVANFEYGITGVALDHTCSGASTDCILYVVIYMHTNSSNGTYLDNVKLYQYGDNNKVDILETNHTYLISSQFKNSSNSEQGLLIAPASGTGLNSGIYYATTYLGFNFLNGYLSGSTNSFLATNAPTYYGTLSGYTYSTSGSGFGSDGNTYTGSGITEGWYSTCTSFLDIGCFVASTFDGLLNFSGEILSFVSDLGTLFLDFLNTISSSSWQVFQLDTVDGTGSCTPQLFSLLNTSNTGTLFEKISHSLQGGLSQILSAWNSPEDEKYYCLLGEGVYIDYGIYRPVDHLFWFDYLLLLVIILGVSGFMSKLILRNEQ